MPRTKQYNIDEVLSLATELFLRKGYEATSLNELVKVTNLNRHSLYNEFEDKEGFFLACVKHYTLEERNRKTVEILTREPIGMKNIEEFLEDRIDYALSDNCYGCLLVNTISERSVVSEKISRVIDKIIQHQESLILNCFDAAIKNKEISEKNDSRALKDYVSCLFRGVMNIAKTPNKDKTSLKKVGAMALSSIIKE